jgi:hypothetical protein
VIRSGGEGKGQVFLAPVARKRRDGDHPLRIRLAIIPIAVLACWIDAAEVRGQSSPPVSAPPVSTGATSGTSAETERQRNLDLITRQLKEQGRDEALAKAKAEVTSAPAQAPAQGQDIEQLKAQIALQQKQIDVLLKMTQLLAEQAKKTPASAAVVEQLQEQVASQEASNQRAARRDQELAQAHDELVERVDSAAPTTPALPATLRELYLPTRTNESPLSIYGSAASAFDAFSKQNSTFRAQTVNLRPYLLLNENWLMSADVSLQVSGVQLYRAQMEWFVNDNLTFVAGRFYSPIGFYNERLRQNWVIKTPDPPLMFNQVYPQLLSFDGLQVRGSRYLGSTPLKLEYNGFVANGLSVSGSNLPASTYSNLNNFNDSMTDVNGAKAFGGRLGLSVPELGLIGGLSGLANQAYDQSGHNLNLWDVDLSWHRGNWDTRFELVHTDQQTPAQPIHRSGLYAQVAYRDYGNPNPIVRKLEWVFRFDHVQFEGINIQQTGINFGGPGLNYARQPLDRDRYTIGVNYWFYPSLVMKLAIEFNQELGVPSLRDNGFIGQLVWGF